MSQTALEQLLSVSFIQASALLGGIIIRVIFGLKTPCGDMDPLVTSFRLPNLLGMLLSALFFRNIPGTGPIMTWLSLEVSGQLRKIALCIIMSFAGLGLDASVLEKNGGPVMRLTCIPWLFDSLAMMVGCYFFMGYDWVFGLTVGLIIATCSPAVIVPGMMDLNDQGQGKRNGITTLMFGASSFEDIVAIATVTTMFNLKFPANDSSTVFDLFIAKDVLAQSMPVITLVCGIVPGLLLGGLVGQFTPKAPTVLKGLLALTLPLLSLLGQELIGIGGSNLLFSICQNAALRQQWVNHLYENDKEVLTDGSTKTILAIFVKNKINRKMAVSEVEMAGYYIQTAWIVIEPLLFGLIGALVDVTRINPALILNSTLVLVTAVIARGFGAQLAMLGTDLGHWERVFMAGAWIPKATVPAALSSEIFERATALGMDQEIIWGEEVITIFIFMILVTAPLGAILISVTGPALLPPGDEDEEEETGSMPHEAEKNQIGIPKIGDVNTARSKRHKSSFRDLVV